MDIDVQQDPEARTLTVTARLDAPVERVWQIWADPRQLERWWGPPSYPATVMDHDLRPGGLVTYAMTGPEGDKHHGMWRVLAVEPPHLLEVEDLFADDAGQPNTDLPVSTMRTTLQADGEGRTLMTTVSTFASLEDLQRLVEMGMLEGLRQAMSQIPAVLAS